MPKTAPTYDLMLLLSTSAPDETRAKILADVEQSISSGGGSIESKADWGTRPMTYQIEHQSDAEYHLLQFTAPAELLEALSYNMRITDGVLRHRIIKIVPGTPAPPSSPPPVLAASHATSHAASPAASPAPHSAAEALGSDDQN